MQDNHSKDFDLQLRSMLEDAAVKPSRRVWKGISARLDPAPSPAAGAWGWMKWAGVSLAAAAALAAGIFFSGTQTSIPTINHNQEQALLAQAAEPAGAGSETPAPAVAATEDAVQPAASLPAPRNAAVRQAAGQTAGIPETAAPAQSEELPVSGMAAAQQQEPRQEAAAPGQTGQRGPQTRQQPPVQDPFAEEIPARVRRAGKPRIALYAQGAIGSNDAKSQPAPGTWMAPGKSSGFSELSSSTYGVPFTLGAGVRIYLLPRFAVGTGVDYSLLTRTFTGSFEEVSGSVLHSLQYIGIPLNFSYDLIDSDKIKFYVFAGGEAEFSIANKYRLFANPDIIRSYPVERPQLSVGGGFGVEFRLNRHLGIYLDPGVSYYFPGNQPKSIRTDKPLLLNFDAGLRFNLGR